MCGGNPGSSPSRISRNVSCGTYLPSTTRQTVNGVESSSPIGPHSHVQNTADTSTASADIPVDAPYQYGSTNWLTTSSRIANSTTVPMNTSLPENSANDNRSGTAAAIKIPMYGTNRNSATSRPHTNTLGNS